MNYLIWEWCARRLQVLGREEMKQKLLADILMDLNICKIEWWDHKEYISDIRVMLEEVETKAFK